jgi:hypothetical protein
MNCAEPYAAVCAEPGPIRSATATTRATTGPLCCFLELQFYPPGWAPGPPGISCDAAGWCTAMAIFSLNQGQNTGVVNNADCLNTFGIEPANFAFITKSGVPHAPPSPLGATTATFTPDPATDLFMN